MTEDQLQAECYKWAWNTFPATRRLLFHIPNGGSRNKVEASKLKSMGVISGIPDLQFLWNGKPYFFELKTSTGTVSTNQKQIHNTFLNQGISTHIVRSLEQFQSLFTQIVHGSN